jgi:hypothetical protein
MSNNNGGTICNYLIIESKYKLKDSPLNNDDDDDDDDDGVLMVKIKPLTL